jgi:hypothetical protein
VGVLAGSRAAIGALASAGKVTVTDHGIFVGARRSEIIPWSSVRSAERHASGWREHVSISTSLPTGSVTINYGVVADPSAFKLAVVKRVGPDHLLAAALSK